MGQLTQFSSNRKTMIHEFGRASMLASGNRGKSGGQRFRSLREGKRYPTGTDVCLGI